jgi:hypothetical protein
MISASRLSIVPILFLLYTKIEGNKVGWLNMLNMRNMSFSGKGDHHVDPLGDMGGDCTAEENAINIKNIAGRRVGPRKLHAQFSPIR